jgi:hypothetical protein
MFTLAVQSAVPHARVGVATASAQFFRQIGSTVGVAVFGALLTNHLAAELPRRAPQLANLDLSHAQTVAMNDSALAAALPGADAATRAAAGSGVRASFASAIEGLFPVSLALFGIGFIVTVTVPGRRLRGREPAPPVANDPAGAAPEGVAA